MVKQSSDCVVEYREHMRDGDGTVIITNFATREELNNKGRMFSKITLNPGCSIGFHIHEGDSELFYFLTGTAEYTDGDTVKTVKAGDVTVCPAGTGYGVANRTDEVVELIAVIVYAD